MTTENEVLDDVPNMCDIEANKMERVINRELISIKYKSFGKVSVTRNEKLDHKVNANVSNNDDGIVKASNLSLLSKQSSNFSEKVKRLKDTRCAKGRAAAVFQLKEDVLGAKAIPPEPSAITDPVSKVKTYSPQKI